MIDFVGGVERRISQRMVHVVHGDAQSGHTTMVVYPDREQAEEAVRQLEGRYNYVINSPSDVELIPLAVLKGMLAVMNRSVAFRSRSKLVKEVWKAMTEQEKKIAKDVIAQERADKKAAAEAKKAEAEKIKADKKAAAEAKKAEVEKIKADKKAAAEAKKAEAAAQKQERDLAKSRISPDEIVKVLVEQNPKREGSEAHKRFALYQNDMTVKQFLDAGGTMADINWDLGHRLISLTAPAGAEGTAS